MWANWVTVCQHMGCSPYFATTGTHPLLPLNIAKVTNLLPLPNAPLSSTDLIAQHAITLQKCWSHSAALASNVYTAQIKAAIHFEQEHAITIINYNFKLGDLILIRNTAIEKSQSQNACEISWSAHHQIAEQGWCIHHLQTRQLGL